MVGKRDGSMRRLHTVALIMLGVRIIRGILEIKEDL
jgi:hypothetical protein